MVVDTRLMTVAMVLTIRTIDHFVTIVIHLLLVEADLPAQQLAEVSDGMWNEWESVAGAFVEHNRWRSSESEAGHCTINSFRARESNVVDACCDAENH